MLVGAYNAPTLIIANNADEGKTRIVVGTADRESWYHGKIFNQPFHKSFNDEETKPAVSAIKMQLSYCLIGASQ